MKRLTILVFVFTLAFFGCSKRYHQFIDLSVTTTLMDQQATSDSCAPSEVHTTPYTTVPIVATQPEEIFSVIRYPVFAEMEGCTFTGMPALQITEYRVFDPLNIRGISTERVDHVFGVASDGVAHHYTVDNQRRFDDWETGALTWDAISEEKVVYLTFDCGYEYENITSEVLDILRYKQVRATFFCTMTYLRSAPQVVSRMILEGHNVGNHSLSHPEDCASLSREEMAMEALAVENYLRVNFGYSSQYFRFPAGVYSQNAVELMHEVGYRCVFWSIAYADWDPIHQVGKEEAFKILTQRLHPGAVILLHTTSHDNVAVLSDFIDYAISLGYRFLDLNEYPGWE